MSIGLWMTPALLAGLFAILWVTARLERLVVTPLFAGGTPTPGASGAASLPPLLLAWLPTASFDPAPSGDSHYFSKVEEGEPCTSEEARSS